MPLFKKKTNTLKKLQKSVPIKRLKKQWRRHKLRVIVISCVLFVLLVAAYSFVGARTTPPGKLVTFHDRGENHVILTHAATIRQALKDANIAVDPKDDVEPAIDSPLLSSDSAVIIYRARPVLVVDGATRERVLTPAQSPNEIAVAAGLQQIGDKDETTLSRGNYVTDGADTILTIKRASAPPVLSKLAFAPTAQALSKAKGAQIYTDSSGVAHRETYYDLPMNLVMGACGGGDYTIRYDGAKVDKDGYVLVAANLSVYPRCTVVETSLGPGKVYDTGGFATRYPHGFDLATDWTNYNGR
jgi:hypothetical protein